MQKRTSADNMRHFTRHVFKDIKLSKVIRIGLLGSIGLVIFLVAWRKMLPIFLLALGCLSVQHERLTIGWLGLDLYTMFALVAGVTYGPWTAVFICLGARLLNLVFINFISPFLLIKIFLKAIFVYIGALIIPAANILTWGIWFIVIQDTLLIGLSFLLNDDPVSNFMYMATHAMTNSFIFSMFGPTLMFIMR